MTAVGFWQVNGLQTYLSQRGTLEGHIVDSEVGRDAEVLGGLDDMHITLQQARDTGGIGQYGHQLAQIEMIESQGEVLKRIFVGRRIELQTRTVVGQQVEVCADTTLTAKHHIVAFVEVECAIGNDGIQRIEMEAETVLCDIHQHSEIHTFTATFI